MELSPPSLSSGIIEHAATDERLIDLLLHRRGVHTQRAYRADVDRFLAFVGAPLTTLTLGDVQAFADALAGLAPSVDRASWSLAGPIRASEWSNDGYASRSNRMGFPSIAQRGRLGGRTP
jgi:hypothetical protein